MDAQARLLVEGNSVVGVLGKGEDFLLFPLQEDGPLDQGLLQRGQERGLAFCGVLGVVDGRMAARVEETNPMAVYTMLFAGLEFARQVAPKLRPSEPKGDSVAWLERLHSL